MEKKVNMLTYDFENIGSDTLYQYLYKCIKNDIIQGKIKSGEKLPSKRALAKNLAISVITVENAYGQLAAEGYIYSVPKSGFYVVDLRDDKMKNESGLSENRIYSNKLNLTGGKNAYIADFTSNQTEQSAFPFSIWTKTMRAVMNDYQTELMLNPPCGGVMELRQSIADYLKAFRNMTVRPEQIIIGAGTEYLSSLLIQLLGKELKYSVENPGYHKIAKIYRSMGACYEYIEIEEDGPKVEELEEKEINVIHCSPSHHYPTGIVMPISKRYELLGWVTKTKDRYIIEDEYDSELRLNGKPIPSLQSIDVSGKVIYMNTFSKTLCSTVRISYMVLPDELAERFYRELSFYSCTVSNFEQYTLAQFMNSGAFEKHINRLRNYYQQKRDRILEAFLQGVLKTKIKILEEDAGVHFLMKVDTNLREEEFLDKMKSKGINLVALLYLPVVMIVEYILCLGIGLIVSALTVYLRDLQYILGIVVMALQYMTPVMYGADMVENANVPQILKTIFNLNPMTPIINIYRQILYYKEIPDLSTLLVAIITGVVFVILGAIIFRRLQRGFAEEF